MKLVTAEQMRAIDRETIEVHGIPGPVLMENAGRGIAERLAVAVIPKVRGAKVAVVCGKGNNGGDGFVVARHLAGMGAQVAVYYLGPPEQMSEDCRLNFERAKELGFPMTEVTAVEALPETLPDDFIVDAVFGTGFSGAPRGLAGELIEYINRHEDRTVIAVDMPSGLNADTGEGEGAVVQAHYTFPLALPKYGLYVSPGRELAGAVAVVPIGVPDEVLAKFDLRSDLITLGMVRQWLPDRPPDGHKGTFGRLLIVAGSLGMTGAAALAGTAAYRCGCGLVKIGCPRSVLPIIAALIAEATSHPLPDVAKRGALALRGLGEVRRLAEDHDAVAVGPGIGRHRETFELVRRFTAGLTKPAVIDADGINAFAGHAALLAGREGGAALVLTPHPGEFARLTGETVPAGIHDRMALVRKWAKELRAVLVLKGSPTLVAAPNGSCFLNPTGNEGMACGGTGDVLTGAIGSFLAQGMGPLSAAVCGVYVHGMAGDFAADARTSRAMIAGDLNQYLSEVFGQLE
ncbi:MAG TPA: NAD(P)H-hydrate dehydratase [candidate division Zixibacteria bacterium]|nr:NAD(P)H-hydrate dehydratase [candidate division Zixibacteria bacterium]MDD4918255.1 NAD(P)H-hydrate dehydratase [candidate division Zixibacteria bacterium]MDM7973996.1 NAD(P)H-hydrate dehydratase [candidate division Zixibacteria bacterium]HOD66513.1 NAD(P)H-hydrate dehydratase [candidate division Zixibacteria bacterium]HOZ06648.1 NAD(P)H-hydrate dehydratase [candidate division Zixibacteria bacterium]